MYRVMTSGAYRYEVVGVERDRCISYVGRRNLFYMMYDVRVWSRAYAAHIEVPLQDEGANLFPLCRAVKCFRVIFSYVMIPLYIYSVIGFSLFCRSRSCRAVKMEYSDDVFVFLFPGQ